MLAFRTTILFFSMLLLVAPAWASVLDIKIDSREVILNGKKWGDAGAYEVLKGTIYYGFDPDNAANQRIVDLYLAPRNKDGLVLAATGGRNYALPGDRRNACKDRGRGTLARGNRGQVGLLRTWTADDAGGE